MYKDNIIPEICFLRFFAVLLVVFFHLDIGFFKNGFIGVDIFLTISGFLMTKIVIEKKLSIKNFYIRRLKRILPVYIYFLLFCIFFSFLFFDFYQLIKILKTLGFSQIFLSNFYFWQSTKDYWAEGLVLNPLLHTWSISLEMQYYLIFPLLFYFKKYKKIIFFSLFCFSLIFLEFFKYSDSSFYLIFARISQFFIGGFYYFILKKKIKTFFSDIYFLFYLLFIFFLMTNLKLYIFPYYYGILISIFTGFFLIFEKFNYFNFILKNKFTKFFSDISYSLFLFHYPLIIFYSYYIDRTINFYEKIILFILSISLSTFSYYKIEKKFNILSVNHFTKEYLCKFFLPIIFFIFLISLLGFNKNFVKIFYQKENITFLESLNNIKPSVKYERNNFNVLNNKKNNIIIFGDSHAQDIYFYLVNRDNKNNYYYIPLNLECAEIIQRKNFMIKDKIYNLFNLINWDSKLKRDCDQSFQLIDYNFKNKVHKFYVSFKWNEKEIYYLDYILNKAKKYSKNIVVFSRRVSIPHINSAIQKVGLDTKKLNEYYNDKKNLHYKINYDLNLKIKSKFQDVKFIDINEAICSKNNKCKFFYNNFPMYIDKTHFSIYGLAYLDFFKDKIFKN
jgi:peptidoglycan/LPS O-acetylase OafA/YrhL